MIPARSTRPRIASSATGPDRYPYRPQRVLIAPRPGAAAHRRAGVDASRRRRSRRAARAEQRCRSRASRGGRQAARARAAVQAPDETSRRRCSAQKNTWRSICRRQRSGPAGEAASQRRQQPVIRHQLRAQHRDAAAPKVDRAETVAVGAVVGRPASDAVPPPAAGRFPSIHAPAPSASMTCQTRG